MSSETAPLQEGKTEQNCILQNIKIITRTLGLLTIGVLWISCVIIIQDHDDSYVGFYLIAVAAIVTFFEVTWILDKGVCCVREGCCCRIWECILWVDTWIKFLMYSALSIPLFMEDDRIWLGIISGLLLIVLGTLYLVKTFRGQVTVTVYKTVTRTKKAGTLVLHEISTQTEEDLLEVVAEPKTEPSADKPQASGSDDTPSTSASAAAPGSPDVTEDGGASTAPKKTAKKK